MHEAERIEPVPHVEVRRAPVSPAVLEFGCAHVAHDSEVGLTWPRDRCRGGIEFSCHAHIADDDSGHAARRLGVEEVLQELRELRDRPTADGVLRKRHYTRPGRISLKPISNGPIWK